MIEKIKNDQPMLENLDHWRAAFPLAREFVPQISGHDRDEDLSVANEFCPKLFVDKDLFLKERRSLMEIIREEDSRPFKLGNWRKSTQRLAHAAEAIFLFLYLVSLKELTLMAQNCILSANILDF